MTPTPQVPKADATPTTALPPSAPLVFAWALPTLISVGAAVALLLPESVSRPTAVGAAALAVGVAALIPLAAREAVMEMTSGFDLRVRFAVTLLCILLFFSPKLVLGVGAPWPLGCAVLACVFSLTLVLPTACHLLLANLLALWGGLLASHPALSPAIPLSVIALLLAAAGVTHQHFRHMRFRRSRPRLREAWAGGVLVLALAVPPALLMWWAIPPEFLMVPAAAEAAPALAPVTPTEAPRQVEILRLMLELAAVVLMGFGLIALAGHLIKRLRQRRRDVPVEWTGDDTLAEEWELPPAPRRRRRRADTPRERIIAAYLNAVDRMAQRGWDFPLPMTAREFHGETEARRFPARGALGDLTALFERAKYSPSAIESSAPQRAASLAEDVTGQLRRT